MSATWYARTYPAWADGSGGGTAVTAAVLEKYESALERIANSVGLPVGGYVTGNGADESAGLTAWVNAGKTWGIPLVGDKSVTVSVASAIDLRAHHLQVIGNGMTIRQIGSNVKTLLVGGYSQVITGLNVAYQTAATTAHTNSIGVEFYACFQGYYGDLEVDAAHISYGIGQSDWDGTGQNTVFSCVFRNLFALGWAMRAMDMRTFPAGGASSTGNLFHNLYLHNNPSGLQTSGAEPLRFVDWDESHFAQVNVEWCDLNGNDLWFFQRCRNFAMTSLHFEGIIIDGSRGLLRPYENCVLTIQGLTWTNSALQADGGRKSVLRPSQPTDAPIMVKMDGVRVRSLSGTATAVCLVDLASDGNSTVSRYQIDNFSTIDGALIGEPIVGDNPYSPCVTRLNDTLFGAMAPDPNTLYRQQASMPRGEISSNVGPMTSGLTRFAFFTAEESRTYSQIRVLSGGTAVSGTAPTLIRLGLYTVSASGAMTLVARTASQVGAFAAAQTAYQYALDATGGYVTSYKVTAGLRYALAAIVISAGTVPTVMGQNLYVPSESTLTPALCAGLASQTDLPATTTVAALATTATRAYMVLTN